MTTVLIVSGFANIPNAYSITFDETVLQAMDQSTDFMMHTVSNRGGFVWKYTSDLTEQWGEIPARKSMIWVQDPGAVGVGNMLLEAYKTTGDQQYIDYAKQVAGALIQGQHPSGGWNYFIDFDMDSVQKWYDEVASKCWGWEEYYYNDGKCTFDDNVTAGATRYLMNLFMTTHDPTYQAPLLKALDFVIESQYPNGGWPQRYPLKNELVQNVYPDYPSFYTFNDDVIHRNIYLLLDAWEQLKNEEYKKAAYRGMDFLVISQLPKPQAGWAQQYDMDMKPASARTYEPAGIGSVETVLCIKDLETFYMITGDIKYLVPIPNAIEWLENSYLPESHKKNDRVTHATFYELGTNKPLYIHREGTSIENGRYYIDHEPNNFPGHYGMQRRINIKALKKEYKRINSWTSKKAQAEYRWKKEALSRLPKVNLGKVESLIESMDSRGAWVEELSVPDYNDPVNKPDRIFRGISTGSYIRNMKIFINYLKSRGYSSSVKK